jgi:Na+/proline symporter
MSWIDWLIVVVPLFFVFYMGYRSQFYVRDVTDFLSAGRVCGRYVICVADVANGLSIISLVAFVEVAYKTGFAISFWSNITLPLSMVLSLTGYCVYRFRETKAMSLGQFLEMRYNRPFRIFAASLRSLSEMLANMICPAVAARFFIYFFDMPHTLSIFGFEIQTFMIVVLVVLTMAISIICFGGTLALVITDTIQGLMCYPMLVVFTIFVLTYFSWSTEIIPVMSDRVSGESFLNPYDIEKLRDFNIFALVVGVMSMVLNRASWIGAGNSSAAKNPHEQKMATVLGTWRTGFSGIFYVLLAISVLTLLNHRNFAVEGKAVKSELTVKIAQELVENVDERNRLIDRLNAVPLNDHIIGTDAALSETKNIDSEYMDVAKETLAEGENGNAKYQEFRTLYHQIMLPMSMRKILPTGLMGLFCLLVIMMMVSTDDSRIFSASLTISQDIILPLKKKPFTPKQHIWLLRWVSIGVGVFFFFGSSFMAQLDYINLFVTIMCSMWLGGAGPVMIFGLYSRFGTTFGAFSSLLTGMGISLGGVLVQRNWADYIYPYLVKCDMVDSVGAVLTTISGPFNPYIVWTMNPVKAPINSIEFFFIAMILSIIAYILGSLITRKEPFNLERMLHRGKYSLDQDKKQEKMTWSLKSIFINLLGITPEYSRGDKVIAWSMFIFAFIYQFLICFVFVAIWNLFSPWKIEWWSNYFLVVFLVVPGIIATISTVWFTIGGFIDLRRLFVDLRLRKTNVLDDGRVEGHLSLADKAELEDIEKQSSEE